MPDDTNRRVAEACGLRVEREDGRDGLIRVGDGHDFSRWVNFEHDEADAVLAAEKFGLFSDPHFCRIGFENNKWMIWKPGEERFDEMPVNVSGTFCEAITQAILRLAAKP